MCESQLSKKILAIKNERMSRTTCVTHMTRLLKVNGTLEIQKCFQKPLMNFFYTKRVMIFSCSGIESASK